MLMGGQACVLYGAAEFSRDTDIAILAEAGNLKRLTKALNELQAKCASDVARVLAGEKPVYPVKVSSP